MPAYAGAATRRRDPGHDLERHARLREHLALLAAAAEDERVAALEPHDPPAGLGQLDELLVQLILRDRVEARLLPDVDPLGRAGASSSSSGLASWSYRTMSHCVSRAAALSEISPGSPGPAPASTTIPASNGPAVSASQLRIA